MSADWKDSIWEWQSNYVLFLVRTWTRLWGKFASRESPYSNLGQGSFSPTGVSENCKALFDRESFGWQRVHFRKAIPYQRRFIRHYRGCNRGSRDPSNALSQDRNASISLNRYSTLLYSTSTVPSPRTACVVPDPTTSGWQGLEKGTPQPSSAGA